MVEIGAALVKYRRHTSSSEAEGLPPEARAQVGGAREQGACRADMGVVSQRGSGVT
ncbi:hypothetical protein SAMN05443432_106155 [Roseovarius litoreus]|uniref:Uncharacterized protein n=1 Tax=Roseovarius litoreus TaxID=1155722 RepID=A0A1M7HV22_9RHOB|nr:hypothetical protein [Roseovarius litoreus]SHM32411.1 hypothetical protein SAMN05443432_106155 [Roseovarius litoreus]